MEKVLEEAELCGALNLAGRKMKEFPSELSTKYDLTDLVSLDLSSNRLSDVPSCVCESRSLESLRLRDNVLRSVPLNILFLRSLTVLDLSNNKIVQLPLSLFELPLEIILLTGNRLNTIPREIRQLSSTLTELDLSCNILKSIPVDMALLKMLRVLNLRRNLLEQFPPELCRLSLHSLDLSCNRLKRLPLHIGKMGSLVEFYMGNNPLLSPPASLVLKGREHVVKWMDFEASAEVDQNRPESSIIEDSDYFSSCPCICRRNHVTVNLSSQLEMRHHRGQVCGSDSGYASTSDDRRHSYELRASFRVGEIASCAVPPQNSEEASQPDGTADSDPSLRKVWSTFVDTPSAVTGPNFRCRRTVSNIPHGDETGALIDENVLLNRLEYTSRIEEPSNRVKELQNGLHSIHERVDSLDLSNNNSSVSTDACRSTETSSCRLSPKEPSSALGKPISKVGPFISTRVRPSGHTLQPQEPKVLKSKLWTPSISESLVEKGLTSSRLLKATVHSNLSTTRVPSAGCGGSNQRSRLLSHMGRQSNTVPNLQKGTLIGEQKRQNSLTSTAKNDRVTHATPNRNGLAPKSRDVQATAADLIRKVFLERLDITLSDNIEGIALELADGIHLCGLINVLRARTIPSIFTSSTTALTFPKAKRNVDNFIMSCRKLGVSERSICSATDILNRKNTANVAKTVLALHKLFPRDKISHTPCSLVDKRNVSHL